MTEAELPEMTRTQSPAETHALARRLVEILPPGTVLALHGDLGAGKTCLVQGLARALDLDAVVSSPTYTLINEYAGHPTLYHIDLYRMEGSREAWDLGLEEYMEPDGYTAIEWAERAGELLPPNVVHVTLEQGEAPDERVIRIRREQGQ